MLKNAARATIESNPNLRGSSLPPVSIVLASNSQVREVVLMVLFSDLGRYNSIDLSLFARTSLSAFLTEAVESLTTKYLTFAFSKRRTLCVEKKEERRKEPSIIYYHLPPDGEGAAVHLHHRREEHRQDRRGLRHLWIHDGGSQ